jgi:hypothetical protein
MAVTKYMLEAQTPDNPVKQSVYKRKENTKMKKTRPKQTGLYI